jgi:2-succinyl-5-enolpyruvyl-6-hydroxy-3-cyclohexene-1-carboxylate synthase
MIKHYTDQTNVQILIALLKAHGIRKVIASPGATNITFVGSIQNDPFFEIYSSVDERSAAYIACGLAAETGEPVALSCTGATASRNYLPGLTEAFYRKLPVLAITSTQVISKVGHHIAQVIDRSVIQNDVARISVTLPIVKDNDDFWDCEIKINKALLELKRHGGGPAHINLPTLYSTNYDIRELPQVRVINRITMTDDFPVLPIGKIGIFIGSHIKMTIAETNTIDKFCSTNNAVVFCDHTSGYHGAYRVLYSLVASQQMLVHSDYRPNLLITIGEITGDYYTLNLGANHVWRVNPDGEIRDTIKKLKTVFEMPEICFFNHYISNSEVESNYYKECMRKLLEVRNKIPELPFSNVWIASQISSKLPENSVIHFGILNSLRCWNFFELPESIESSSNVGGFGIDGGMSSLIGASFADVEKLHFLVIGDLAFFYDMNVLGNRHVGNNIRILLVNNGKGTEFRQFNHPGALFEDDADEYIAAAGHFGNKSEVLVKHYAMDLGFEYYSAKTKEEFLSNYERFLNKTITAQPMIFEVFTDHVEESLALQTIISLEENFTGKAKNIAKKILNKKAIDRIKKHLS